MASSSIHIAPVKSTSESHNLREKESKYIREDWTYKNFNWGFETTKLSELAKTQKEEYKKKIGQKMQSHAVPIREGVFLIEERHTNEELLKIVLSIEEKFGIRPVQFSVHRDEGHWKNHPERLFEEIWKPNLHAHVVFDWQNKETKKSFDLKPKDMRELQSYMANALGMERGKKSSKKHIESRQFKVMKLNEEIDEKNKELINLENDIDHDKKTAQIDISNLNGEISDLKTEVNRLLKRKRGFPTEDEMEKKRKEQAELVAKNKDLLEKNKSLSDMNSKLDTRINDKLSPLSERKLYAYEKLRITNPEFKKAADVAEYEHIAANRKKGLGY
jgi:hypothetical protein